MSSQAPFSAVIPSVLADDGSSCGNDPPFDRSDPDKWYFPTGWLDGTPSRRCGIDPDKELAYRQKSADFIQIIGLRLRVEQLCMNTAIVYMHRFYMFHSFTDFHWIAISTASLFLAAKVEDQPRDLELVTKIAHYCLHMDHHQQIDAKRESAVLVMNEIILLQTLRFDVTIDHPHTHVTKFCQLVSASEDLRKASCFIATISLHLTTMCLKYKPTVVACVCMHLACKWSGWEIPRTTEGKDWFWFVDHTITTELLEQLMTDFLLIFKKSPTRLEKIMSLNNAPSISLSNLPYHLFDSSRGQQHQKRSRSPSPKRQAITKPGNSQQVMDSSGKRKPHCRKLLQMPNSARPEFGQSKREGSASGNVHHSQSQARTHGKLEDARHDSSVSGMPPSHSSQSSGNDSHQNSHHNMPYLGQHMDRSSGSNSSSNPKIPCMDSRSKGGYDINRHRGMPLSDDPNKRSMSHGTSIATNRNNNGNMSSVSEGGNSSGPSDSSHAPSKSTSRPTGVSSGSFGQNSQMETAANKYYTDKNGGLFGSINGSGDNNSSGNGMSLEERRKRRLADGMPMGNNAINNKRPRSEAVFSVPISINSLFSPEELNQSSTSSETFSSKRIPPISSQFSPSALEGAQPPERSQIGTGNTYGGLSSSEGVIFGSSTDTKSDIRIGSLNPSLNFQAPSLLQSIGDSKNDSLLSSGNVLPPRAASLFSPEFTPSNTIPSDVNISPPLTATATEVHNKRDSLLSNIKQETTDIASQNQHVANSYSEGGGIFTGRLSGSPKREDGDDYHSGKKSKRSKKEKLKHKHKDKKNDKHRDKEKEEDKENRDKYRSKDRHSGSRSGAPPPPVEVSNNALPWFPCPGFGSCVTCKRHTADDIPPPYRIISTGPGLKVKFAKIEDS